MALLTKSQILDAEDLKFETVAVPEWGGEVRVCTISGAQRLAYEEMVSQAQRDADDGGAKPDTVAMLVAGAVVDEKGAPLFSEADVPALAKKSGVALRRVFDVAMRLNVLSRAAVETQRGN